MPLYHADIGLPDAHNPRHGAALVYGLHALRAAQNDNVAHMLPTALPAYTLVKVETLADCVTPIKWVVRTRLDADRDLVLVVTSEYFVKTVWVNAHADQHLTLDRSRYSNSLAMAS